MLRTDLKYVSLDFETTGLNPETDEAIQIGIAQFDHTWKLIDTFSSYIKPEKSLSELKDMVRVVTWLSIDQLMNAPHFADIQERIAHFFDESTVLIGHNIPFDIKVLEQHMEVNVLAHIDTFPLAQALIPFSQSYALEVLDKSLTKENNAHAGNEKHHDALYDAYAAQRVFLACIERINVITQKYPYVFSYLSRAVCPLRSILAIDAHENHLIPAIPVLSKSFTNGKKLLIEDEIAADTLPESWKYFIGNTPLKQVLKKLPKEHVIFSFSQRHKVQIAKHLLHELGLTHVESWNAYLFDKKLLWLFFQKKYFDQEELYFALKYFYHVSSWHSSIDLTTHYEWKIYHALKEKDITASSHSLELLTHEFLYEKMRDQSIMPYTTIFFFDQDRWYDTHMKWQQKPFDMHALLQITDSLIYRDTLVYPEKDSVWEPLHTKLVITIGVRQTEVAKLLKDVSNSAVEVDALIGNTYFYKTSLLIEQINELLISIEVHADPSDYRVVKEKWEKFMSIITNRCNISTRLYGQEIHFLVKTVDVFLEYSEFQQLFSLNQTMFLSAIKKDRPALITSWSSLQHPLIVERPGKEKLAFNEKNIYVFSNNKQISEQLLIWLHSHKPSHYKVHGENITGGKGKNVFAVKASPHNIIIGGYDFYLQCVAQKINIDIVYKLCINGPLQHIISSDLLYYGNMSHS